MKTIAEKRGTVCQHGIKCFYTECSQVLHHIEDSDLGCGGGGGRNSADVFRLAGLTFMTNANAQASSSSMSLKMIQQFHLNQQIGWPTAHWNAFLFLFVFTQLNHARQWCVQSEH